MIELPWEFQHLGSQSLTRKNQDNIDKTRKTRTTLTKLGNFPTNYHYKKQTHKQTDDVIALRVKQTNKSKTYFQTKH